jgi:hypothetical protein
MKKALKKSKPAKKKIAKKPAKIKKAGKLKVAKKQKKSTKVKVLKKKVDKAARAAAKGKIESGEINELIERGRPRGFVTDNEILYYFPKIEDNVKLLDEIYDRLENAGIKVIETSALIDFSKDEKEVNTLDDSMDLGNDVPDAVQMYLKEIGKTALLTKDEERDLAKRAEKGD